MSKMDAVGALLLMVLTLFGGNLVTILLVSDDLGQLVVLVLWSLWVGFAFAPTAVKALKELFG